MLRTIRIAAITLACLTGAAAQARDLTVPAGKGWKHAETGIVVTATILGMPRTSISDSTENERDVALQFDDAGQTTSLTYYIFHPAEPSVPIWFDRAQTQIQLRETYGGVTPATAEPVAFASPHANVPAALRQVYAPMKPPYRATGLAVLPVGEWLVAVRLSSVSLDPAALDAKLSEAIAALRWPDAPATADGSAVPIRACADTQTYKKAKLLKPNMMQALIGGSGALAANDKDAKERKNAKPVIWCRNGEATAMYGVYRADEAKTAYILAIGDSGRVATVGGGIGSLLGEGGYEVNFRDLDGSVSTFPSVDRLPEPAQLLSLVTSGSAISRFDPGTKGGAITIDSKLAK